MPNVYKYFSVLENIQAGMQKFFNIHKLWIKKKRKCFFSFSKFFFFWLSKMFFISKKSWKHNICEKKKKKINGRNSRLQKRNTTFTFHFESAGATNLNVQKD